MKQSVYLHDYVTDVLTTFGDLNDVINKVLDASDDGMFDIQDKPECEARENARRYNITITNQTYIQMVKALGERNKSISLRRLLYWFVENEIYNDLGWEPIREYVDKEKAKFNKQLDVTLSAIDKLWFICKNDEEGIITHAKDLLLTLKR